MVLESPRAGALFRICNPTIAAAVAMLAAPRQVKRLRRQDGFPGIELLALLVGCQILLKIDAAGDNGLRRARRVTSFSGTSRSSVPPAPKADTRTRWAALSSCGRSAPIAGGATSLARKADRSARAWAAHAQPITPLAKLLRERHSTRSFDDQRPITLAELARFLDGTARVLSQSRSTSATGGLTVAYAVRPYPSAGACYEPELYLAVDHCEGLARGSYHYDAGRHALVPIGTRTHELEALLRGAQSAMDAPAAPQVLITIAARFGRVSWKYSSLAYALILKDVGVLTQTLYLMAIDMGLGGCAVGITNVDLFAKMTGIEFHVEGPVGQFALGRGARPGASG
jgi:SagB-type dehydrogenase family enzyme